MKTKLTTLVVYGTLLAGSLVLSIGPALARDWDRRDNARPRSLSGDYRHRSFPAPAPVYPAGRHRGWDYPVAPAYPPAPVYGYPAYGYPVAAPAYSQDLYRRLENARRKKAHDATHHASREQLAEDNARIARLERQLGLR
jgi:hypothetical protein